MIKVYNHIDQDHIRNTDGSLNEENGLRLMFKSIGLNEIHHGEIDDYIWDETLEFLNKNSTEYYEFICNEAGFNVANIEDDLLTALALQVELNNKTKQ